MSVIPRLLRRVDDLQQGHPVLALPLAVLKKFGDDQAGNLAALVAYYAFLSLFPLLLLLVTVLGVVLRGNPELQHRVLDSALRDFPIIGTQLEHNVHSLNRTGVGLAIGIVGTLLGARGVANALQNAMNTVWNVPYVRRPGFPWNQLRSFGILAVFGLGVLVTTVLSGLGGSGALGAALRIAVIALAAVLNMGLFLLAFRLATATVVPLRQLWLGAVIAALGWQVLQTVGGYLVAHELRGANEVYGLFGLVLGLLSWLYLQAQLTLYAVEVDVVRAHRLWPRGLQQPPLTEGDERAYSDYVHTERRRPEQRIGVTFRPEDERKAG